MQPIPYIFFNGTCGEAFRFYADVFGAPAPEFMTAKDMPEESRAYMKGVPDHAVMHVGLQVGSGWIYGSDSFGEDTAGMAGCNVHVSFPTVDEAHKAFAAISEGGEVRMPIGPTFWAPAFGACSDKYGVRWMIAADPQEQA
ncbi:VOC family protein [Pseudoprimorskyibacter insulae]|uniref:Glyoxalase/fosfomycin resistance/dioxygenase domain-containing protein n=1 Tax=Pseudoprimorskyibacter insulae TaxID=1695997 RepID=A0A2R8AYR8_9RHOB|nr:VOC family protein [Pseudoprimorskyibacter insulae]SPF81097.1 hypothetical protein PRI8871_02914 [Pseudoprimorskyibacter insulae]